MTNEYHGYVDEHRHAFSGNHSHSSFTITSNDSSMDGVDVYRADQDLKMTPCRFVKGHVFKRTVLTVVILNTVLLGARTYFVPNYTSSSSYAAYDDDDDSVAYQASSTSSNSVTFDYLTAAAYVFLSLFTIEICLKLLHYQQHILRMGWTLVDIAVVIAAWCVGPSITVLRLTRLKGVFKKLPYTQILIKSLVRVLPQMAGILLILTSIFYAFAVILTSFCPRYFTSLGQTMWFLLNLFFLHQWDEMSSDASGQYPHAWILLLIFTILTTGMLSSLVVAVMVNAVAQTHRERLDKSLDSDGISTKKRHAATSPIMVSATPMDMMTMMSNSSSNMKAVMPSPPESNNSDSIMLLEYCQRLESKLDALTRTLERMNDTIPTTSSIPEENPGKNQQQYTPLMNAARAKRESFRSL